MKAGCCSAISPCPHQQRSPATLCDVCAHVATSAAPPARPQFLATEDGEFNGPSGPEPTLAAAAFGYVVTTGAGRDYFQRGRPEPDHLGHNWIVTTVYSAPLPLKTAVVGTVRTIDAPMASERVIFANARRICKRPLQRSPNWVLAMEVFGLGSTWAWALCRRIGVNPDGRTMDPYPVPGKLADATPKIPPVGSGT